MHLKEILSSLSAPKGITSIINGVISDDFTVLPHQQGANAGLIEATEMVEKYEKQIQECKSDWQYWSILGDLEYWRAIMNVLKGAVLVGEENMPDRKYTPKNSVVMDEIYNMAQYGETIFKLCEAQSQGDYYGTY